MSSRSPPLASDAAHTPLNAAAACVGLPLRATWPAYCGSSSSANVVGHCGDHRGVAADGDVAAVVVEPVALGVLLVLGDVVPGRHLVGRGEALRLRLAGEVRAQVEDVGSAVLAPLALDGVELVLAGAVRRGAVDLDVVLLAERVEHLAVVRPVRGQRDDVERALGLGGLDEGVHVAEVLDRRRGGGVGVGPAAPGRAAVVRTARGEGEPGGDDRYRGPQGAASHVSS